MHITRLQLHNYRNYARADVSPCTGITVFHGDNAQGKTALLEAVYLCCTGRSHRTVRDRELIRWGETIGRVTVDGVQKDGDHQVEIALSCAERKLVKINGCRVSKSGELMGHVLGVLFSPEDLRMVKDGPAERRRFIDMELSQIRPAYYYQLQRYTRALTQRGRLLRDIAANPCLSSTLSAWDEQLALSGAQIIEHRRRFVGMLGQFAGEMHGELTGGLEKLTIEYQCSAASKNDGAALSADLLRALETARAQDIRRGVTSIGPHRDDLVLRLNGIDARAYGSQGQQRSCALSLKLSELRVMREETGEYPVLMLDDVMSELDPKRRRQLLFALSGIQTLITCTDPSDLAGAEIGRSFRVSGGVATAEE